jgi:glucose/mannose transport system permease protein
MNRRAERHFVLALGLAAVLQVAAVVLTGMLERSLSDVAKTGLALLPWIAIIVAVLSLYRMVAGHPQTNPLLSNRLTRKALVWAVGGVLCLLIFAYGSDWIPNFPRTMKATNAMLGLAYPFSAIFACIAFLVAAGLSLLGAKDDGTGTPGSLENTFVKNFAAKIAAIPMVLTALGIFIGATGWTIYYSFTSSKLLPKNQLVGFDQYERLWNSDRWLISIENLMIYGACSLFFSLIIGFVLAALLDQKIRFENTFRSIFLFPFALSFIVTGLVWQWILTPEFGLQQVVRNMGFTNFTFDPLYNADIVIYGILIAGLWQGTGLIMCLMLAGLRGIDEDVWKAARVDGIPMWKTYIMIIIPMMRPVFITTLVIIAAGIVKVYDLVVAQTSGGPGLASEVPAKYVYDYMFGGQNLAQGFAGSTMMLLSVLIVVIPWAYLEFKEQRSHG